MKKIVLFLLIMPLFMATQCEEDQAAECHSNKLTKNQKSLVNIENLKEVYTINDTLWIKSDLNKKLTINATNETIDLFNYDQLTYKFNFDRVSKFNSEMYLCINEKTTVIEKGNILSCNKILYNKTDSGYESRIGIKLLEAGNYRIQISQISSHNSDCNADSISILSSFNNNTDEWVNFSVK